MGKPKLSTLRFFPISDSLTLLFPKSYRKSFPKNTLIDFYPVSDMLLQTQSLSTQNLISRPSLAFSKPITRTQFPPLKFNPLRRSSAPRCSISVVSEPPQAQVVNGGKPFPAEVSRTIMELSSVGTLSTLTQEGLPVGVGIRFAVDQEGTPVLCLNPSNGRLAVDRRSSLHVQLEQSGLRTPQCTIQGSLEKPEDRMILKRLNSVWEKRFGKEVDEDLIYIVAVDQVLQMDDFMEGGVWVTSSDYRHANPDPLKDFAEKLVDEINTNNMEDVLRFCNIYADLDFQVLEAKMIWVDRLGFDMRLCSPGSGVFEVRIPFPREVTNEKGARSSFNCMSQLAWEIEKNYQAPNFVKVRQLKQIS